MFCVFYISSKAKLSQLLLGGVFPPLFFFLLSLCRRFNEIALYLVFLVESSSFVKTSANCDIIWLCFDNRGDASLQQIFSPPHFQLPGSCQNRKIGRLISVLFLFIDLLGFLADRCMWSLIPWIVCVRSKNKELNDKNSGN